jgi:hypothetical protein
VVSVLVSWNISRPTRYHGSPSPYVGNGQWAQNRNGKKVGHVMLIVGYNWPMGEGCTYRLLPDAARAH